MNDDTVKPDNKNRQKKQAIVAEVTDKVNKAKVMVFTNYQGMTHRQLEGFKKALRKVNAELVVTKNTLLKRALASQGETLEAKSFEQPTATLFGYEDQILPLKELAKVIKLLQLPKVKFGFFSRGAGSGSARDGWDILSEDEILKLSTLPSREVLLAQLVGTLKSPIYGLHRALSWNMTKLVLTLKAIETKKS